MSGELRDQETQELAKLVRAAQKGEEQALVGILRKTQARLLKFAYLQTGNAEIAEELCQEAYIKAFAAIASLDEPERVVSWLFRILKNLVFDRFRLVSVRSEKASEDLDLLEDPAVRQEGREDFLYIRELLQCLEAMDRAVVLAVHLEGYSYCETAELLGLTEDAVRSRLQRARKKMLEKAKDGESIPLRRPSKG